MTVRLYCIYDKKGPLYLDELICFASDSMAIRQFSDYAKNPNSAIGKHPEDYALAFMGEFDNTSGIITPANGGPQHIAQAHLVLMKETKE